MISVGCEYCMPPILWGGANKNWGSFSRKVDDSVTIASSALQIIGTNHQGMIKEDVTGEYSTGMVEFGQINPGEGS